MSGHGHSESGLRHLIAFFGTLVAVLAFWGGYASGVQGWWWTAFGLVIVYGGIYKIIDN